MNYFSTPPKIAIALSLLLISTATLIAGCSGGGEDSLQLADSPVPMLNKADVLRELRNVNYFVAFGSGDAGSSNYGFPYTAPKRGRWESITSGSLAKAEPPNCESGSADSEDGAKPHAFQQYALSRQVDFTTIRYKTCRITDVFGLDAVTFDGFWESGEAQTGEYEYFVFGENGQAAVLRLEEAGVVAHLSYVGVSESRLTSNQYDSRDVLRRTFEADGGSAYIAEFGAASDPFIEIDGGGRYTVNGPYRYISTECAGGSLRLATLQPLSFAEGYPTGGQLRFSSGDNTATVTIQSDNGATISFSGGRGDSISPEEMREMYDSFATECVPLPNES